MEEQKVKVVFKFDRKDYENVLFLLDQKQDKDTEQAWETMIRFMEQTTKDKGTSKALVSWKACLSEKVTIYKEV